MSLLFEFKHAPAWYTEMLILGTLSFILKISKQTKKKMTICDITLTSAAPQSVSGNMMFIAQTNLVHDNYCKHNCNTQIQKCYCFMWLTLTKS